MSHVEKARYEYAKAKPSLSLLFSFSQTNFIRGFYLSFTYYQYSHSLSLSLSLYSFLFYFRFSLLYNFLTFASISESLYFFYI